jgi:hypothetical protein
LQNTKQLIENNKFQFQFDAVNNGLVCCLNLEVVGVLGNKEANIQQNDEDINDDEVPNDLVLLGSLDRQDPFEAPHCLPDIEPRYDRFLYAEADQLYSLIDIKGPDEDVRILRIAAEKEDCDWNMKDEKVDNDHNEDPTRLFPVGDDEMEA